MKKVLSLLLALVMCLSLCACGNGTGTSTPAKNNPKKYGTVFLYQHDKWDLYKATQISETTIKIENWGRFDAAVDGDPFKYEYDVGVISTADATTEFKWLDEEHTAFSVKLTDEQNSYMEGTVQVCFTVEATDSATRFSYQHDKWDLYKAVQLSESTIKIENWGRFNAGEDGDPFKFEYDLCVISTADTTTDFKWLDDTHSAFSITLYDEENSYWDEACVVTFVIVTTPSAPPSTEATVPPTTEDKQESPADNGIDPDFKAAMDSYEKFFDEYVEIMKKYKKNPADLSILADYAKYMGQYADMMQKLEAWENEDLNTAETAYYIEVQARITGKLLELA